MPAVALPTEPHDTPSNPVSLTVSRSGEYLHISPVMSPLHIFRDAAHDTSSIYSSASLVRDSSDQEILSPHCHAPSLQSNSDDDDVSEHGMPFPQAIWALPTLHSPAYVAKPHPPNIPRCTPLMPATSQESPKVCSMICEVTFDETCFR